MKKIAILCLCLSLGAGISSAQSQHESFQNFRKGILNDYNNFRRTILDHYADFLNGEWHEYESLNGEKRDRTPKPSEAPTVKGFPKRKPSVPSQPAQPMQPEAVTPARPSAPKAPERHVSPELKPSVTPARPEKPAARPSAPAQRRNPEAFEFNFYELPMQMPQIDYNIAHRLSSPSDFASQWKKLESEHVASRLLPAIKETIKETGFNDYLTFRFLESYVNSRFPETDDSSRMAMVHYLLANLGYDARIAVTTSGVPLLLLPFDQTIYARNYMMMRDGKYYIFAPEGFNLERLQNERVLTCQLPADAAKGKRFDLVLGKLNIPVSPKHFDLSFGPIHIEGDVNANLMPILYHYPQMPVGDYARSNIQPDVRNAIARQVREQLKGMKGDDAVGEVLKFMHNVFDYSTDEDFHGFEKPYFVEETLFYPKNDCEDRAIFYTRLLWDALGRESQLISFPGHEAAAVRMDSPVEGTSYSDKGETFYISDPTYIGSVTGMIMPIYKTQAPNVDYTFGK